MTTKKKLEEMSAQLGELQESLKRIETIYLKQLSEAPQPRPERGAMPEVKGVKLNTEQADAIVQHMQGQFAALFKDSPLAQRSVDMSTFAKQVHFGPEEE